MLISKYVRQVGNALKASNLGEILVQITKFEMQIFGETIKYSLHATSAFHNTK